MTLDQLAAKHGSDKTGHHNYCPIYDRYLAPLRDQRITLMELGIGGYEYPDRGGASLKMWYDYFPKAEIIGVDLHPKDGLVNDRTTVLQHSQDYPGLWAIVADVVIDDASHINPLTIQAFKNIFPSLKPGGYYFVEDIEASWCPADGWAAGCADPGDLQSPSAINFFRLLLNDINAQYIPNYQAQYEIEFIHFYKNIIVIKKQ